MISKPIDNIDKSDIEALIENGVRESKTIEYKRELPGKKDKDKKEFLSDVSSFANAGGGDLIYGIEEDKGLPKKAIGLKCENVDEEMSRLHSIIRDGIAPRIQGIRMEAIKGFEKGPVLLIRIPQSWIAPHMVTLNGSSKFYIRNSAGKHQMDVTEIRTAFLQSEALSDKIKRFRDERIGKVIADETPVPLVKESRLILHVLPVSSFATTISIDIADVMKKYRDRLRPVNRSRFNIDGLLAYDKDLEGKSLSYCQLFRQGQIEAVYAHLVQERPDGRRLIPCEAYEVRIVNAILKYFDVLRAYEVQGPVTISICLVGVKGVYMGGKRFDYNIGWEGHPIDRDILILPEITIHEYESIEDRKVLAKYLRSAFDALWNACGFERSYNYDENGNWKL